MNAIRELFTTTTASKLEITAASIVAKGAAAHAATLDALFDHDDGWKRNARHGLIIVDDVERLKREAPITWDTARVFTGGGRNHSAWPPQLGGWIDERFPLWISGRFPRLVSVLEPHDARLVVWLEGKLHAFARVEGQWLDEAGLEARAAAERDRKAAAALAENEAFEAVNRAQQQADERDRAEIAERVAADRIKFAEASNIRAAAAKAEAERLEAERFDALAAIAADPLTVLRLAEALDLVDERGNLRAMPKVESLVRLDRVVFVSAKAHESMREHLRYGARAAVVEVAKLAAAMPGRRPLRVNINDPRARYEHVDFRILPLFAGDRLVAHVDHDGVARVLDRDERAPLSWWT